MVAYVDTGLQRTLMTSLVTLLGWLWYEPVYRTVTFLCFVLSSHLSHVASGFALKFPSVHLGPVLPVSVEGWEGRWRARCLWV